MEYLIGGLIILGAGIASVISMYPQPVCFDPAYGPLV